jgi:SAM-dependent methyltransferase
MSRDLTVEEATWTAITATSYNNAVYEHWMFRDVFEHELRIARALCPSATTLVEVGCGTCMFAGAMTDYVEQVFGVDISPGFLEAAKAEFGERLRLIEGDASMLDKLLRYHEVKLRNPLIACVMNTLGIMPGSVRVQVLEQMARVADGGQLLVEVHNADHFEQAVDEFYRTNPELCGLGVDGVLKDSDVSMATKEVCVRDPDTGETLYYSHWFSSDELSQLANEAGIALHHVTPHGIGLFLEVPAR